MGVIIQGNYPSSGWIAKTDRRTVAVPANCGMQTYIAVPNILGPEGSWTGGCEKAPAAICFKVAMDAHYRAGCRSEQVW
jgi:hypothetical protein